MNRGILPRPSVQHLKPAEHGAPNHLELRGWGLSPDDIIDFSVNSNPYGPSPGVHEAIAHVVIDRYPDRHALALREALATHHGISSAHIVIGNGTAELIRLIALAYIRPGDRNLILAPTFGEYEQAVQLMEGTLVKWRAQAEEEFAFDLAAIERILRQAHPRFVWICNPNNPTGRVLPPRAIAAWADTHPHTLFIVDEAYINFVPDMMSMISLRRRNVLVLRSMTKDYALAGLRLGYAVGPVDIVEPLERVRPPWNVNALAQAAGIAALADQEHLRHTLEQVRRARDILIPALKRLGLRVFPTHTHFFLVYTDQPHHFRAQLLSHGIQVRDATSFGLPTFVRIATRRPEENECLLQALERCQLA